MRTLEITEIVKVVDRITNKLKVLEEEETKARQTKEVVSTKKPAGSNSKSRHPEMTINDIKEIKRTAEIETQIKIRLSSVFSLL
jgi:hypothetical protein